jgi:hypothetical protein
MSARADNETYPQSYPSSPERRLESLPDVPMASTEEILFWDAKTEYLKIIEDCSTQDFTNKQVVSEANNTYDDNFTESAELDPDERIIWRDFVFDFSNQAITGTSALPTNRVARMRNVVNAINDKTPLALFGTENMKPVFMLETAQNRLKSTNKIGDETIMKADLLSPVIVLGILEQFLVYQNDPVYQALAQVRAQYKLAPSDYSLLHSDVLLSTKHKLIHEIYDEYIRSYKEALAASKRVSRFLINMSRI